MNVESQHSSPKSLWTLYRDLIALRLAHPPLSEGKESLPVITGGGSGAVAILRTHDNETVVFAVNFQSKSTASFEITVPGDPTVLLAEGLLEPLKRQAGKLIIPGLGARGFAFIQLKG